MSSNAYTCSIRLYQVSVLGAPVASSQLGEHEAVEYGNLISTPQTHPQPLVKVVDLHIQHGDRGFSRRGSGSRRHNTAR